MRVTEMADRSDVCRAARPTEIDERDREDYFTPSSRLFEEFCGRMIEQYGLNDALVRQETVASLDFGRTEYGPDDLFTVRTDGGRHYARAVVMAAGPGETPRIPAPFAEPVEEGAVHAARLQPGRLLDPGLAARIKSRRETNVLVIGGGLTSAQISDALVRAGVTRVWQLVRGSLRGRIH